MKNDAVQIESQQVFNKFKLLVSRAENSVKKRTFLFSFVDETMTSFDLSPCLALG